MVGTKSLQSLRIRMAAIAFSTLFAATAQTITVNELTYSLNPTDKTATVVTATVPTTGTVAIEVPATVTADDGDVYAVTAIGDSAFYQMKTITAITLPEGIETIGVEAFSELTKLSIINIPSTVTKIDDYAFYDCSSIVNLQLPDNLKYLGEGAFYYCSKLDSMPIPESVEHLGMGVFYWCSMLRKSSIPKHIKDIPSHLFRYCNILEPPELPEGLRTIGQYAFCAVDFVDLDIPETVTSIGAGAFGWCDKLVKVHLPEGLEVIDSYAFTICGNLEEINIPSTVTAIGIQTFAGDPKLKTIVLPSGIKELYKQCFAGCTSLTNITLPSSLTKVYTSAFQDCTGLKSVKICDSPETLDIATNAFPSNYMTELYIGRNLTAFLKTGNKLKSLTLGNYVTEIPASAFKNHTSLTSVRIGRSLEAIPAEAFASCALTEIVIPSSVQTIGENAFASNPLTNVIIGHGLKQISANAFANCNDIRSIYCTAEETPVVEENSFSITDGSLFVTDAAIDAYSTSAIHWNMLTPYTLVEPEEIAMNRDGESGIELLSDDPSTPTTFQLTATITPYDVSLPHIYWMSSNPQAATVDLDGLVTVHDPNGSYSITAHSLYNDKLLAKMDFTEGTMGIEDLIADEPAFGIVDESGNIKADNNIYNIQGMLIKKNATEADIRSLPSGFYIVGGQKLFVK
ncbi:MAG: leucine-rich repeat protein [Bacteroides sp.]|nr:leucine-rich repeat protein [Bacteroides sp.]MCM1413070.1 leucine-rich repeat protein [Bacteroides sp.]MCM1471776.1 leucine-rich repeat protein [Bacteroides sp.]